jgi:hypothetical protein
MELLHNNGNLKNGIVYIFKCDSFENRLLAYFMTNAHKNNILI